MMSKNIYKRYETLIYNEKPTLGNYNSVLLWISAYTILTFSYKRLHIESTHLFQFAG